MESEKPMMIQYRSLKAEVGDCVLFFRLGGFYEMLGRDAYIVSNCLGLKVVARRVGGGQKLPMCGVPARTAEQYAKTLMENGYAVAICDQVEGVSAISGVVNRAVTRVMRPEKEIVIDEAVSETEYEVFLAEFEAREVDKDGIADQVRNDGEETRDESGYDVMRELCALDMDSVSPREAWNLLCRWREIADQVHNDGVVRNERSDP